MRNECIPTNGHDHAELFKMLATAVQDHLHTAVDADTVKQIVDDRIAHRLPAPIEIHLGEGKVTKIDGAHRQLRDLLSLVEEGHKNLLLVGPAGSGKTTLARNLAESLDLEFGFISLSAGITESHLLGRTLPDADGSWKFKPSKFVEIYENGGVFLLDEVDAADANVMVAVNAALANGHLVTTDGVIHTRHAQCFIIAAANTWGRGGDHMYVGRNALDAATLDRFVLATLHITYDEALEARILGVSAPETEDRDEDATPATGEDIRQWVTALRESIQRNRLRRVASTRLVIAALMAAKAGRSLDQIKARFFQDWSADEKAKVCHA